MLRLSLPSFALGLLTACGGGDGGDGDAAVADETDGDAAVADETDGVEAEPAGGDSMATLTVGGESYSWAADKMELCLIGGDFPVDAEFREVPRPGDGDWFQFFDRGDGGVTSAPTSEVRSTRAQAQGRPTRSAPMGSPTPAA